MSCRAKEEPAESWCESYLLHLFQNQVLVVCVLHQVHAAKVFGIEVDASHASRLVRCCSNGGILQARDVA